MACVGGVSALLVVLIATHRHSTLVARCRGSVCVCVNINTMTQQALNSAQKLILATLRHPIFWRSKRMKIRCSVGT